MDLVQAVFIRDIGTLNRWKVSFLSYVKEISISINKVYLIGFVTEGVEKQVTNLIDQYKEGTGGYIPTVINKTSCMNEGKSKVLNRIIHENFQEISSIILYMDSDIVIDAVFSSLEDILKLYQSSEYDVLVPNHREDVRHNLSTITEIDKNNKSILRQRSFDRYGFAGGCYICRKEILQKYTFENVGEYGPEDILWFRKLFINKKKVGLISNLFVIHPFDNEEKHKAYKREESLKKQYLI